MCIVYIFVLNVFLMDFHSEMTRLFLHAISVDGPKRQIFGETMYELLDRHAPYMPAEDYRFYKCILEGFENGSTNGTH